MNDTLRKEIEAIRNLKTKALKERYRELFGEQSPSSNRAHLFRRIAWRMQALAEGDLSERARERAAELANDVDLRLRAPLAFWRELERKESATERDARLPPAGTELSRKYNGQIIRVKVLEHDFEYKGSRYESLSAIASQATGTRWNGFQFFRLRQAVPHE